MQKASRKISGLLFISLLIWIWTPVLQAQVLRKKTELILKGDGTSGPFFISGKYILTNTEKVQRDTLFLEKDKDYLIDYNKGLLWLKTPLGKGDSIVVSFEEFLSGIKKRYFHRELSLSQEAISPDHSAPLSFNYTASEKGFPVKEAASNFKMPLPQIPPEKPFSSNLQISGTKSFSLDLGNLESFSLSQGLNLSIGGDLTRDVKVVALISDQGKGGTPEGTTRRLDELDRVLMQVTSPHFNGLLGDQYLSLEGNLAGRYDKKLQGIQAEGKFQQNALSFSYATSKGKYNHNSFSGIEGRQGPYYLTAESGQRGIEVLPGTEKVYLDGVLLQRGSENDYTIDYSRGVLDFTSSRLITGDSRIKVEFEYSDQSYAKSFYDSKAEATLFQGKMKFKGLLIDERDDLNNPLSYSFSSQDKEILKSSGEDKSKAFKDGAHYVGAGKGDYLLLTDSSGNSYYEYAGKDSGSFQVNFSWVGSAKGAYVYSGAGIFKYIGPGKGDYQPVIFLPLPSSHSIVDLDLGLAPFSGFSSEIGWSASKKDLNLFSDLGNADNSGNALLLKTGYEKKDLNLFGHNLPKLKFEGLYRNLGENFSPFGRTDEIERERVWGLYDDSTKSSEKIWRLKTSLAPVQRLTLDLDLGTLKKGNSFSSNRKRFDVSLRPFSSVETRASSEQIKSSQKGELFDLTGDWQRRALSVLHHWKIVNSELCWNMEQQAFDPRDSVRQSRRYDEYKGRVGLESRSLWSASTQLIYRQDQGRDSSWKKAANSYTWQNRVSLRNYKEVFSSNVEYTYRAKNLTSGSRESGSLGAFKLDYYPKSQSLVLNLYYSVNQLGSERGIDNYIQVGERQGQYRVENGEYIPDPEGNYILQKEFLGEYVPGRKLEKSFRAIFYPGKVFPKVKSFKQFYTDTFVRASNLVSGKASWYGFLLNPFSETNGQEILTRDYSLRQDFFLFPSSPLNFRLRLTSDKRENNLILSGRDLDNRSGQSALIRYRVSSKNLLESEVSSDKRKRDKVNFSSLLIHGKSLRMDFTRRENNSVEVTLSSKLTSQDEKESGLKVSLLEIGPRATFFFSGQGKLHSEISWTQVKFSPAGMVLPWEMAEGKKPGDNFTWLLSFDYKLNQALSAGLNLSGWKEPSRGTRHNGKFEVKAYF